MKRNGFTLIELLVVIFLISIASVSSIIIFGNINDQEDENELEKSFINFQRAALMYYELDDDLMSRFYDRLNDDNGGNDYIEVPYSKLVELNYFKDEINDVDRSSFFVKIYVRNEESKEGMITKNVKILDTEVCYLDKDSNQLCRNADGSWS